MLRWMVPRLLAGLRVIVAMKSLLLSVAYRLQKTGMASSGAGAQTVCPPSYTSPVSAFSQRLPAGNTT